VRNLSKLPPPLDFGEQGTPREAQSNQHPEPSRDGGTDTTSVIVANATKQSV